MNKLNHKDLMRRFNVPPELESEIKKRVRAINRIGRVSNSSLNRRSSTMQKMYIRLKEMPKSRVSELQKLVKDWDEARKTWESTKSHFDFEKNQAAEKKLSESLEAYRLDTYNEPELTVIRDFEI